jgi:hypothetical protein
LEILNREVHLQLDELKNRTSLTLQQEAMLLQNKLQGMQNELSFKDEVIKTLRG